MCQYFYFGYQVTIIAAVTSRKDALPMWRNLLYWSNSVCYPCPIACIRFVYIECFDYVGMKWQRIELQMWHYDVALFTQLRLLGDSLFVVLVMQLHDFHFARLFDFIFFFIFMVTQWFPESVMCTEIRKELKMGLQKYNILGRRNQGKGTCLRMKLQIINLLVS